MRLSADKRNRLSVEHAQALTEEYIAMVGHELRAPLSAIINWVQVLQKSTTDQALVSRAAQAIEGNARSQAHLVNDLLDVSRAVVGKMELSKTECDLDDVVRSSLMTIKHKAQAKRISINHVVSDMIRIHADERRLQQVVVNLQAYSDGPGRGATFTLRLPCHREQLLIQQPQTLSVKMTKRIAAQRERIDARHRGALSSDPMHRQRASEPARRRVREVPASTVAITACTTAECACCGPTRSVSPVRVPAQGS